jgi:hypothetical protein
MPPPKPAFRSLLSPADLLQYSELSLRLSSPSNRYKRNHRLDRFEDCVDAIRAFCVRSDAQDWKRCLVCGLFWFAGGLCINTGQLKILLGKSKSSINGALAKLGYEAVSVSYAPDGNLMQAMPFMLEWPNAARQWTMRKAPRGKAAAQAPPGKPEEETDGTNRGIEPCYYGCLCGCNCRPPGEVTTIPCLCDLVDASGHADHPCACASAFILPE